MMEDMYIHFALDGGCGVTSCTSSGLDFLKTIGCNLESWTRLTLSSHALLSVGQCLSYMRIHACTHMETKRSPNNSFPSFLREATGSCLHAGEVLIPLWFTALCGVKATPVSH